jgi:HAD superfamily hydrolase (TIGR01509 family)
MNPDFIKEFGMDPQTFWAVRRKNDLMHNYCLGKINQDEFLSEILRLHGISVDKLSKAKELYERNIFLVKDIKELLEDMKKHYRLVLVAGDGKESLDMKLDKFGLRKYFDSVYCTCYEGFLKSSIEFYKIVLEKEKLKPEECLFIDDQERFTNIAADLGMSAIVFHNTASLIEDLRKKSIL